LRRVLPVGRANVQRGLVFAGRRLAPTHGVTAIIWWAMFNWPAICPTPVSPPTSNSRLPVPPVIFYARDECTVAFRDVMAPPCVDRAGLAGSGERPLPPVILVPWPPRREHSDGQQQPLPIRRRPALPEVWIRRHPGPARCLSRRGAMWTPLRPPEDSPSATHERRNYVPSTVHNRTSDGSPELNAIDVVVSRHLPTQRRPAPLQAPHPRRQFGPTSVDPPLIPEAVRPSYDPTSRFPPPALLDCPGDCVRDL